MLKQSLKCYHYPIHIAAAFGRLCVETFLSRHFHKRFKAAAFGRLCVETVGQVAGAVVAVGSRLRAAVC